MTAKPLTYTLWLVGPLAALVLATKLHKLLVMGAFPLQVLAGLFPDLLVSGVLALVTWALLHRHGVLRWVARPLIHMIVLVATLLVFVDHGFWLTTGTLLDPAVLRYGLSHMDSLGDVYLSAMGPLVWLGLGALILVHVLPVRFGRRVASDGPTQIQRPRRLVLIGLASLLLTGLAAALTHTPRPALGTNVLVAHLGGLWSSPAMAQATGLEGHPPLVLGRARPAIDGPPNVVFVLMESVRARSTTPYSPSLATTPFLAKLAARGAVVEDTWTTVTHTSKALVSALCGIYPLLELPVVEARGLPVECLAKLMKERGYATAFMQPAAGGFEERRELVTHMGYELFVSKETLSGSPHELTNYFGYEDEALLEPALAFTADQKQKGRPFFLTLLNLSTHHTYDTPSDHHRQHDSSEHGKYLDAITYFDGVLERLFEGLARQGVLDRTLVVLVGDHGEAFGEHGTLQHNAAIHEEGLHVPLVVVGPGIAPGTRIKGLRQLIDLVPTTLEWLGTPVVSGLPGKSLLTSDGHERLFASCWLQRECVATRESRWKLIWHYDRKSPELYDLETDPMEREDRFVSTPESVWRPMLTRLLEWERVTLGRWHHFFQNGARDFVSQVRPDIDSPRDVVFRDSTGRPLARLIGVEGPPLIRAGAPMVFTLHWEVLSEMSGWYPFTYLVPADARERVFDANHPVAGGHHPVRLWRPGTFVSDRFELRPDPVLSPGRWSLAVGFFNSGTTGVAARAFAEAQDPASVDAERRAHVFELVVTTPSRSRGGAR